MLCAYPRTSHPRNFACGLCMPCRINTRRKKTGRLLLEARAHQHSSFVTLTIDDEQIQHQAGRPTLVPRDLQLFLKRVRAATNRTLRYFAVGEYGNTKGRPHYHAIFFGIDAFEAERLCEEKWNQGFITASELTVDRASYCAQYTTKKLTKADDFRLGGEAPEFSRQSLKPTLSLPSLEWLAELHRTDAGSRIISETGDVNHTFRHDGRIWPIDYYMKRKLRAALGMPETGYGRPLDEGPTPGEQELAIANHHKLARRAFANQVH